VHPSGHGHAVSVPFFSFFNCTVAYAPVEKNSTPLLSSAAWTPRLITHANAAMKKSAKIVGLLVVVVIVAGLSLVNSIDQIKP